MCSVFRKNICHLSQEYFITWIRSKKICLIVCTYLNHQLSNYPCHLSKGTLYCLLGRLPLPNFNYSPGVHGAHCIIMWLYQLVDQQGRDWWAHRDQQGRDWWARRDHQGAWPMCDQQGTWLMGNQQGALLMGVSWRAPVYACSPMSKGDCLI